MSEVALGALQWKGRGLDGREINMVSKVKSVVVDGVPSSILILRPRMRDWREWVVWASGKSNYYISKLLNQFFNAAAFSFPATLYFALSTATLTAASTGATVADSGLYTGYARVGMTANTTNFPTSTAGAAIQNAVAVTFGADTVGTPSIASVAILDASTLSGGNILYWATITATGIAVGDTPQINVNGMTASEA